MVVGNPITWESNSHTHGLRFLLMESRFCKLILTALSIDSCTNHSIQVLLVQSAAQICGSATQDLVGFQRTHPDRSKMPAMPHDPQAKEAFYSLSALNL